MDKVRLSQPDTTELEIKYVTEAVQNNWLSAGAPPVKKFEQAFALKFGVRHALTMNSGGSALFLAVKALGIGAGDEVIVPTFTMMASALAVSHTGATPIFADSLPDSWNIDPAEIEKKITVRTKAIMVVHLYGFPCRMKDILEIARKNSLAVIEDAAEAHGAKYQDKFCGTMGDAGCFSFYASKTMTTGEGGMLITNRDELAKTIERLGRYDLDPKLYYWHELEAWSFNLSALQGALGLAQLERLENMVAKRRQVTARYNEAFANLPGITLFKEESGTFCAPWLYSLLVPRRDELTARLAQNDIESKIVFIPLHRQPAYARLGQAGENFPNAERFAASGISLPSGSTLAETDQDRVIAAVQEFFRG